MKNYLLVPTLLSAALVLISGPKLQSADLPVKSATFTAWQPSPEFKLPPIVLQYNPTAKTGTNWAEVTESKIWYRPPTPTVAAAFYLQDGLKRMTGQQFPVISSDDLSHGIVLTLLRDAPEVIRKDSEVLSALKGNPKDPYAANEAYFIRSTQDRVLIVANTENGLTAAAAELLDTVDYEILGMGVDWIHVPDYHTKPLTFTVKTSGRPSFYLRKLFAHSGQSYGNGTIMKGLTDPDDEGVLVSYTRWMVGTRMYGQSMPGYPGHALQMYHRKIMDKMRETGSTEGFYATVEMGPESKRPAASPAITNHWWFNTDPKGTPGFDKIFSCDGTQWTQYPTSQYIGANSDVSTPLVREIVFDDMKKQAEASFTSHPDDLVIFATEVEDGGVDDVERARTLAHPNWYPEYLAKEKLPFGRPYLLNGHNGLKQPKEIWDPLSPSNHAFAFAGYLLHEFDKWIDSLPKDQQVTSTGKSKKELIRCSFYSYNYNDVPPDFNPDGRIRAEVALFPKHRGLDKWEKFVSQEDIERALHILLPDEPSSEYGFYSNAYYNDAGPGGIPASIDASAAAIAKIYRRSYAAGCRGIEEECDFNFGKNGLLYYLTAKEIWNAQLSEKDLDAIRTRWFQRAYGSAWKEMKTYYDFMLAGNYVSNSPNTWGQAIRLIDAADKKLAGTNEPDAQRRLDDLKQYWYVHYLLDSGKFTLNSPEMKEFLWKGQMSYINSMVGLLQREYKSVDVHSVVGPEISAGRAHYTHEETQAWWPKILDTWTVTPVSLFSDAVLANGKSAKDIDLNDLVAVNEFSMTPTDVPFLYNSGYMKAMSFLMAASQKGDTIGFKLSWPFRPSNTHYDTYYIAKKLPYGVDIWDPVKKKWNLWIDNNMTTQQSVEVDNAKGDKFQVVDVQLKAPQPGVYRFSIGYGGNVSYLGSPAYDPMTEQYANPLPFTYSEHAEGLSQSGVYIYIPKGTKSLDLEVWDTEKDKSVTLYQGLPTGKMTVSRKVDISKMGVHKIPLNPGEDGSFAMMQGTNFFFPYLYSVPTFWAKSPTALLIPRAIAEADGLTILGAKNAQPPKK